MGLISDNAHLYLDAASFIPGPIGIGASAINSIAYLQEGEKAKAAVAALGTLQALKYGKVVVKVVKTTTNTANTASKTSTIATKATSNIAAKTANKSSTFASKSTSGASNIAAKAGDNPFRNVPNTTSKVQIHGKELGAIEKEKQSIMNDYNMTKKALDTDNAVRNGGTKLDIKM